jgi:hypothetical protein
LNNRSKETASFAEFALFGFRVVSGWRRRGWRGSDPITGSVEKYSLEAFEAGD